MFPEISTVFNHEFFIFLYFKCFLLRPSSARNQKQRGGCRSQIGRGFGWRRGDPNHSCAGMSRSRGDGETRAEVECLPHPDCGRKDVALSIPWPKGTFVPQHVPLGRGKATSVHRTLRRGTCAASVEELTIEAVVWHTACHKTRTDTLQHLGVGGANR